LLNPTAMTTRALSPSLEHNGGASHEPSAVSAVERAVEAAQRLAVERLELMKLELEEGLGRMLARAGLMLAAGLIAILGWTGLAAALVVVLAERLPMATSLALVAGSHVLAGIVLALVAASMTRRKT
jgi:hypothetical protein